jgi:hypothetical protein
MRLSHSSARPHLRTQPVCYGVFNLGAPMYSPTGTLPYNHSRHIDPASDDDISWQQRGEGLHDALTGAHCFPSIGRLHVGYCRGHNSFEESFT